MIRIRWVSAVRVRNADQRSANNLDHRRHDVAGDEDPENELGPERRVARPVWRGADEYREHSVDGGGKEDRCDDDEEVLYYEVGDAVGIAFCAECACDVADDFLVAISTLRFWCSFFL